MNWGDAVASPFSFFFFCGKIKRTTCVYGYMGNMAADNDVRKGIYDYKSDYENYLKEKYE